ncbi:MAG: glycerophosphodiester phosphodiesterase [Gemmatimonadaceae bacterium]
MPPIEIVAHRGASKERPENTVAAFLRAVELGADGVELDVHLTADNVLVVHHDEVPHEPQTPELAGRSIHSLTLGEVRSFRVRGEVIPTLEEVIRAVADRAIIYCELKGPGTAPAAVALLRGAGARAAVHAFDHRQIAEARVLAPDLARGVLEASYHIAPTASLESVDARDLWMASELIDRDLVTAVHARGCRLAAWTVDAPAEMERLAALGVDSLCTNDVALCRAVMGR